MRIVTTWLWASICALKLASSYSVVGFVEDKLDQDPLSENGRDDAVIITMQHEENMIRLAEIANVHITVKCSGVSKEAAREEAVASAALIDNLLHILSTNQVSPVGKWTSSQYHYPPGAQDYDFRGFRIPGGDSTSDDTTEVHRFTTRFIVPFHGLDALTGFAKNITTSSQVFIERVGWDLAEDTLKEVKRELRSRAIRNMMQAAEDYTIGFGKTSVKPLGVEERYFNAYQKAFQSDWGEVTVDGGREESFEAPEMEISARMEFRMRIW